MNILKKMENIIHIWAAVLNNLLVNLSVIFGGPI